MKTFDFGEQDGTKILDYFGQRRYADLHVLPVGRSGDYPEAFVTDWDDTVADTGPLWKQAHGEELLKRGLELTDEEILSYFGRPQDLAHDFGDESLFSDISETAAVLIGNLTLQLVSRTIYRRAKDIGIKYAVFSSSPHKILQAQIDRFEMEPDAIVSLDDVSRPKPSPEGALSCLRQVGVSASNAIMIDDSWGGVTAAAAANIAPIKLDHPLHRATQIGSLSKHLEDPEAIAALPLAMAVIPLSPQRLFAAYRAEGNLTALKMDPALEMNDQPQREELALFLNDPGALRYCMNWWHEQRK